MLDGIVRPRSQALLEPLGRQLASVVAPTTVTVLAAVVGLASAYAAWRGALGIALGLWLLNRLLDGLDGAVARAADRATDVGGYLDLVLDFAVYAAIPTALVLGRPAPAPVAALAVLLGVFYVNAVAWLALAGLMEKRALVQGRTTALAMPPGLVGGTETALFYAVFLLDAAHLEGWLLAMAALTALSAVQRVAWAVRHLGEGEAARGG